MSQLSKREQIGAVKAWCWFNSDNTPMLGTCSMDKDFTIESKEKTKWGKDMFVELKEVTILPSSEYEKLKMESSISLGFMNAAFDQRDKAQKENRALREMLENTLHTSTCGCGHCSPIQSVLKKGCE